MAFPLLVFNCVHVPAQASGRIMSSGPLIASAHVHALEFAAQDCLRAEAVEAGLSRAPPCGGPFAPALEI